MTMKLYKPFVAGVLLMASPVVSGFAQSYPQQQGYQGQQGYQQLDNLVAPIALYPDALLSQVLVASTYPQQLAEASQWLAQMGNLPSQQLVDAAQQQNWDPSVQALVAFPDVLRRLTQDPRWTADLGNAFLNDEAGVMNAVQGLRARAQEAGRLQSTPQQTVTVDNYGGEQAIGIAPTNPEVVYVPTYDPYYVWGAPAYGYYPSLYYPTFGFGFGSGIAIGAFFGGYRGGFGHWGWGPQWHDHRVYVNNDFFYRNRFQGYRDGRYAGGSNVWRHNDYRGNNFSGSRDSYRQPVQPNNNGQGFRSNGQMNPGYQAPARPQSSQPQSTRPEYSQQGGSQPRGFQGTPRQQMPQQQVAPRAFQGTPRQEIPQQQVAPRAFQGAPRQEIPQQQVAPRAFQGAPRQEIPQQQVAPRAFQGAPRQQFVQPRNFQQAPQQFSRPSYSQPQAQRFEQQQRSEPQRSGRMDAGRGGDRRR